MPPEVRFRLAGRLESCALASPPGATPSFRSALDLRLPVASPTAAPLGGVKDPGEAAHRGLLTLGRAAGLWPSGLPRASTGSFSRGVATSAAASGTTPQPARRWGGVSAASCVSSCAMAPPPCVLPPASPPAAPALALLAEGDGGAWGDEAAAPGSWLPHSSGLFRCDNSAMPDLAGDSPTASTPAPDLAEAALRGDCCGVRAREPTMGSRAAGPPRLAGNGLCQPQLGELVEPGCAGAPAGLAALAKAWSAPPRAAAPPTTTVSPIMTASSCVSRGLAAPPCARSLPQLGRAELDPEVELPRPWLAAGAPAAPRHSSMATASGPSPRPKSSWRARAGFSRESQSLWRTTPLLVALRVQPPLLALARLLETLWRGLTAGVPTTPRHSSRGTPGAWLGPRLPLAGTALLAPWLPNATRGTSESEALSSTAAHCCGGSVLRGKLLARSGSASRVLLAPWPLKATSGTSESDASSSSATGRCEGTAVSPSVPFLSTFELVLRTLLGGSSSGPPSVASLSEPPSICEATHAASGMEGTAVPDWTLGGVPPSRSLRNSRPSSARAVGGGASSH